MGTISFHHIAVKYYTLHVDFSPASMNFRRVYELLSCCSSMDIRCHLDSTLISLSYRGDITMLLH